MTDKPVEEKVLACIGRAMGEFSMLRPGDRVAVGVSGGKDSLCLIDALAAYRRRAPFPYEVVALTLEQGKFQMPIRELEDHINRMGVDWILRDEPRTLGLVADGVDHGCDVCSRNRRGALYQVASELGCTVLHWDTLPMIAPKRFCETFSLMAGSPRCLRLPTPERVRCG